MGFNKVSTSHDYIILELFNKIFEEIKLATPKKGFPYVEHGPNEIKYYPNINHSFYNKLRTQHADNDLKGIIDCLEEEGDYYDLETLEVPKIHNAYLDYALLLTKFNHYYPYTGIKHTYRNNEYEMETQNGHLKKLFMNEFYCLPTITIDTPNNNRDAPTIYDFFTYPYSEQENLSRFKQFTMIESRLAFYEKGLLENLEGGEVSRKLAIESYDNPYSILYPNTPRIVEFYNEDTLIFSDFIRLIYYKEADPLLETNIYNDCIIYPCFHDFVEGLVEHDNWEFLNFEFAGYVQYNKLFYEKIENEEDNITNNSFELLIFHALHHKYSILDKEFDIILANSRFSIGESETLTDSQLIQYIIDTYQNIIESKTKKVSIFKGLKLSKKISDLYIKVTINLFKDKKIKYDKRLHEAYVINPNKSNIEFNDLIGSTKIPVRNKNHGTFLDKEETYLLMLLLRDENVFLDGVNDTLLQKITESLTGYSANQLHKSGSDISKIIKPTQREKYDKIQRVLRSLLKKIDGLKKG